MTALMWICSVLLIAEFVMAPINLWTGRTMPNFTRFTGLSPQVATTVFAPVKLLAALLVAIGLAVHPLGVAGAVVLAAVCAVYLIRLAAPGRRDPAGVAAFGLGLILAVVLAVVQAGR